MNKRKLICLMSAALLCFSAASCGDKEKKTDSSQVTTAAASAETTAVTTEPAATASEAATEAETMTAAEETTAEVTSEVSDDCLPDAVKLFEAVNTADMMQAGGGIEVDEELAKEFTLKINESIVSSVYFMVTDTRFKSLEQVKQFVNDSLCGELLEKYKSIYEGDNAAFKEYNGYLYFTHEVRSSGFEYTSAPEITESSEDAFTAKVSVNSLGVSEVFTLKAVKQDEKWKASSLTISKK